MKYLTQTQVDRIRGMSQYWEEVIKREDKSPLSRELSDVYHMLGVSVLWILSDYANGKLVDSAIEVEPSND